MDSTAPLRQTRPNDLVRHRGIQPLAIAGLQRFLHPPILAGMKRQERRAATWHEAVGQMPSSMSSDDSSSLTAMRSA